MRYVAPLTAPQQELLEKTRHQSPSPRARARAHSLLLSAQGRSIPDIAQIYHVDRDTVATWLTNWEQQGEASLYDRPRSGRPPKLTRIDRRRALGPFSIGVCKVARRGRMSAAETSLQPSRSLGSTLRTMEHNLRRLCISQLFTLRYMKIHAGFTC